MGNSLEEWSKHLSKRTGKTFWYNKGTDERVWGDTPPQLQTGAAVNFQCTVSSHKKANNDGDTSAPVHTPISVDSESLGQKRTRHRASNNLPQRLQQEAASQVASISIINKEHLAPPPPAGSHLPTNRQRNNNTDPATDNSKQNPHLLTANDSNKQRNIPIQPQTYMNHRSSCHPQYPDEHRCSIITASNLPAQDISSPKQRANGKWRKQHNSSLSRTKRSAEHMDSWNNCERDKQRRIHHRESTATSFSLSTRAGDTVDNGTVDNGNGASSQIPCLEDGPSNPHLGQVYEQRSQYISRTDVAFDRFLREIAPKMKYRRRRNEKKTVIHWGQRKLFMSELSFFTQFAKSGYTVVYAGAAPGTHTAYLIELFPDLNFVLVDPAPFSKKLVESDRVTLRQELFTDDIAREFVDFDVLFVCDIRSADWQVMKDKEVEAQVQEDMKSQERWHNIIAPVKSMLKFRLPWAAGTTKYLNGDIELPVWGPITTTEARLIPSHGTREWDNTVYEEQMFYFNTVTRVARYHHGCSVDPHVSGGLDYCFDCKAEVEILKEFLIRRRAYVEGPEVYKEIARMSRKLSQMCGGGRTLATGNVDPSQRKAVIQQKQWIEGKPAYEYAKDKIHQANRPGVYSDVSQNLMKSMGYKDGAGLGKDDHGMAQPVAASDQVGRRGLGFAPSGVPLRATQTTEPTGTLQTGTLQPDQDSIHAVARGRQTAHVWMRHIPGIQPEQEMVVHTEVISSEHTEVSGERSMASLSKNMSKSPVGETASSLEHTNNLQNSVDEATSSADKIVSAQCTVQVSLNGSIASESPQLRSIPAPPSENPGASA